MNFCSVPYEADYGMYADSKMKSVPQYPMNMNPGQGQGQAMNVQPLNPPQMNLQMQMPSGIPQMSSYPMQGMPLNMMPGGGNGGMTPMSTMSTQLPIGAMAPLSSMTMMPMMGNTMGSIDAPGINAVLPDLQPMSTMGQMQPMSQMGQMGQMQPMQQFGQSGSSTQLHQGRLTGGASSPCPSSPSHACSWNPNPGQMMANSSGSNGGGMWQYSQPMQQQQQQQPQYQQAPQYQHQQHQHHHQQQQQHQQQQHHNHAQQQQQQAQQQQQGHRMKSTYDLAPAIQYRDVRNGLNSPSMHDSPKYSKGNNSFNCGKTVSKVPHWR